MPKRASKNPDVNQTAFQGMQSLLEILDPESLPKPKEKNPAAVALGKLGGEARAANLSHARRKAIAKKASQSRRKPTKS